MPFDLEENVLRSEAVVQVHARPHPGADTVFAEFKPGLSLREILGDGARMCRVEVGGFTVPENCWHLVRPKVGVAVIVTRMPEGGSVKSIFRIIAFAALAIGVVAISGGAAAGLLGGLGIGSFTAGSISAGILAASVGLVGSLIINALIPPQTPSTTTSSASVDTLRTITGTQNQLDPYGAVPIALGQILMYPKLAAKQFSELSGDDQYLRVLLDLGEGTPDPSDMKIGDADLSTFTDVESQIGFNPSLFSQDVDENAVTKEMDADGSTAIATTAVGADEVSIDLSFSQGLFGLDASGNVVTVTASIVVQYAPAGSGAWTNVVSGTPGLTISNENVTPYNPDGSIHFVNGARKAVRAGIRWHLPYKGQWDVKLTRLGTLWGSSTSDAQVGALTWTVIRTIRYTPVSSTGTKKIALRIKATDQLNGSLSQFNCIVSQEVSVWTGTAWIQAVSRNPAWIFRWLLSECPANPRRVDYSRLDDVNIMPWAVECDAKGYVYSNTVDQTTTLFALLQDVCAAGRASFNVRDGKYSVVRDLPQSTPVQVFTPRNSSGFSGTRAFPDAVHALRAQFINPDANWQQDERIVYDDGYGDAGMVAANPSLRLATNFEVYTLRGVTDADAAWRLGRYHLAVGRLRPNTYSWNADVENLVCNRGDLVLFAHDVLSVGLAWGRITGVVGDASNPNIGITLDQEMYPESGKSYAVRIRRADGVIPVVPVTFAEYDVPQRTAIFASSQINISHGDLVTFGESGQDVLPLIVTKIQPGADFSAKITAVDAAPEVLNADAGTPPPWTSSITGMAESEAPDPPSTVDVNSSQLLSPSDDGGITQPAMIVSVTGPWSGVTRAGEAIMDHIEIRYRTADPVGAWTIIALPRGELSTTIYNVTRGVIYQVEARAVAANGRASSWTAQTHTVEGATLGPNETPTLSVPSHAGGRNNLFWTPVPQADVFYTVAWTEGDYHTDPATTWNTVGVGSALQYTDYGDPTISRYYCVWATTYAGVRGEYSNTVPVLADTNV